MLNKNIISRRISYVKYISNQKNISEADYMRFVINKDVQNKKLDVAINAYKFGEISLSKGAEMSDITKREFMFKLEENNVPYIGGNKIDLKKSINLLKKEIINQK